MIKTHEVYYPVYKNKDKFIILITGGRSSGKALPLDEVVLTPWGYKPIGCLVEGEYISSVSGGMQRVTELHPIEKRDYLRLYFDDGTSIKCSREHLWEVYVNGERKVLEAQSLCGGENVRLVSVDRNIYNDHPCAPVVSYGFRDGKPVMIKRFPTNTELDNYREQGRFVRVFYYRGERYAYISFAHKYKTLVSVSKVGRCVGRCISVSDESGLFLTRNCTITHNSFQTGTFIERLSFELGETEEGKRVAHQILYTRYTMVSAEISVIPEFLDKVDADGTSKYFHKTKRDVVNVATGATIMFRGIHTSSGNQTAKLKSIHGLTTFVVDEAEEWTNEKEFDTIMLSIRQKGLQNRIIIMMNPTDSNHFIYQRYIKDTHKIVEYDGVPVQISTHPNVLHIHTTYLDNIEHCGEQFLKEVEIMKRDNPDKYAHIVMGQWADVAEGAVFKHWGVVDEMPTGLKNVAKGMDLGYTCFVGDTLIETSEGAKPIRDVKVGDMVMTSEGYRRVVEFFDNGIKEVSDYTFLTEDGYVGVTATANHPVWTEYGYEPISEIEPYDFIKVFGKESEIEDVWVENTREERVYNLEVEEVHEYTANGLLVHNCDPTACVKCGEMYTTDGVDLYIDEQFYQTGMLVGDIIRELKGGSNPNDGHLFVYSESADPRMIDEIFLGGVIIYGVQKYAGSILAGIEKIKDYSHIFITKRSFNIQNEFRNYTWAKDTYGNFVNQPIDAYNHGIDAIRYYVLGKIMGKTLRREMRSPNSGGSNRKIDVSLL